MMPFSEIFENHQSVQQLSMEFPVELSSLAEDDLVELVWDKGQITMRSQSSRVRNSKNYVGKTAASTIGRFDSFVDEADLSLVDDMVPWFDDLLPETSGVTMSDLPIHNSLTPQNKSSVQTFESLGNSSVFNNQKLVHTNGVDTHSSRTGTVCSESSADKTSNCQMLNSKMKDRGSEKSDYQSEDVEEERVGVRKSAPGREGAGLKRNRDTQVHNLSERRRRERINEKMRALQELMPNCNKVDKASMLDEVIEYLKTLQRQVQTMSMGAGVYMPQMMIPAAHVSHFASMGMGYGMQMFNTNGSPMFPDPSIQRPHYPSPLGSPNLGYPGQGLSISVPRAPLMTHVSTNSSVCVNATSLGSRVEVPSSFPTLNSMDRVPSNFKNDSRSQGIKSINSNPPSLQLNNGQELHRIDDGNVSLTNENVALVEKQVLLNPEGVEMIS